MDAFCKLRKLSLNLMLGLIVIPLDQKGSWQTLSFSSLPKHEVTFGKEGMEVSVDKSAMPLIYPLSKKSKIKSLSLKGSLSHLVDLKDPLKQGEKGFDDFSLKIGLVIDGNQTLGWLQKKIAPEWITRLFSLAPKGGGVKHIHFLAAVQSAELKGRKRDHPLNEELLKEHNVWVINEAGEFQLHHKLEESMDVVALWVSIDGDDTGSKFKLQLKELQLITLD
tara:strand:+ start:6463 stop:7128 length:666 start_codon:yes stop_codon:yes gene_type:complete